MNEALPAIDALESIGASLLALERRMNLAPAPGLALDTDAWQLFANPLERLDALVPPLPAGSEQASDEAPVSNAPRLPVNPAARRPTRLPGFDPGASQSPEPAWRTPQPHADPPQTPFRQMPGFPSDPIIPAGAEHPTPTAPFASSGLQIASPSASLDRSSALPMPPAPASGSFRTNPEPPVGQAPLTSQTMNGLPRESSETRLVSGVSGLAALLQANLKQSASESGRPLKPQAAAPQPQTADFAAPGSPPTAGMETPAAVFAAQTPAVQPPEFSYPAFLPPPLLPDNGRNPVGPDNPLTQSNPGAAGGLAAGTPPGASASADLFEAWLDDLELAYLRTYGTSGI